MPRQSNAISDTKVMDNDLDKVLTIEEKRHEAIDGVLQIVQFGCLAFGQFADAGAIGMFGPPMVDEAVKLAGENSKIASKVDLLIEVGPYAGIIAAALPFAAQILVNHKVFKASQFANAGVVEPSELEARMKTEMMRKAMEAMRQQQQVEEEMLAMQEEMRAHMNGDKDRESANTNGE